MKELYSKGDVMKIEIVNNNKNNIWIENLSLEKQNSNNSWEAVVPDLLSLNCGKPYGIQEFLLKTKKRFIKIWDPKIMDKQCFNYKLYDGQFKIAFNYGYSFDSTSKKLYSN